VVSTTRGMSSKRPASQRGVDANLSKQRSATPQ